MAEENARIDRLATDILDDLTSDDGYLETINNIIHNEGVAIEYHEDDAVAEAAYYAEHAQVVMKVLAVAITKVRHFDSVPAWERGEVPK